MSSFFIVPSGDSETVQDSFGRPMSDPDWMHWNVGVKVGGVPRYIAGFLFRGDMFPANLGEHVPSGVE